jgi:hypothetical protein
MTFFQQLHLKALSAELLCFEITAHHTPSQMTQAARQLWHKCRNHKIQWQSGGFDASITLF